MFPPIGAQGLNLGIRDVQDLVRTASDYRDDPGAERALTYDRRRRSTSCDARPRSACSITRCWICCSRSCAGAGPGVLKTFSPVRAFFMREGMQPGSGFARMVSSLREQVSAVACRW